MPTSAALPATEILLMSGGDSRILLDPATGTSPYGCRFYPDPNLVALGSSTASTISEVGFEAAHAMRTAYMTQLGRRSPDAVYTAEMERLRSDLLRLCGFSKSDGVRTLLAASGTDIHAIVSQWLRPSWILMVEPPETGSGVPAAIQGKPFDASSAYDGPLPVGAPRNTWQCELLPLSARTSTGDLREPAVVDAECTALVDQAASTGKTILLVLTDVSKTGLIVPGIQTVLALKRRWPRQIEVLVDACQYRLSAATLRAYVSHGFMVAVTGSKFISGPTFCGALIASASIAARHPHSTVNHGLWDYSCAADRPADSSIGTSLPAKTNIGLLLRWAAALAELRQFYALPDARVSGFLREFATHIHTRLRNSACFEELPVARICRQALCSEECWDTQQTIFPFLLFTQDEQGKRRPLGRDETHKIYQDLMKPPPGTAARTFQLGQPVECGQRNGTPVSALRLCVSARMAVAACSRTHATVIKDAYDALATIEQILSVHYQNYH